MTTELDNLLLPGNTLSHLVKETISELQQQGLLLTKEEADEYYALKREASDEKLHGRDAANVLGVTTGMITQLRNSRMIKGYRVGRRWMYFKLELLEFKNKRTA